MNRRESIQTSKPKFNPDEFVKPTIPKQQVIEIKQAFDTFDEDLSGMIDPKELREAFNKLGFGNQNKLVYQILAELDEDHSGGIGFQQFFKLATAKISEKDSRQQINKVFNTFDSSKQRKINIDDLKKVLKDVGQDMTEQEIKDMFGRADLDDDGYVTQDDFYNMMTHKVYWDQI